jgi:hypothetical protein
LAHGSIYTLAENESVIDTIILVSENKKEANGEEYRFLNISTEDFKSFLFEWFAFIEKWDISKVVDELDGAEE